jgi:cytochrome c5
MSKQDDGHKSPSTLQPMVIIFGLILVAALVVLMIKSPPAEEAPAPVVANVEENIKPVAAVEVAPAVTEVVAKTGEEVVKGCAMCHEAGLMNAPKIGDKGQWEPRIAQGYATLVKHAVEGIRTMPAKGGNPDLTESEIAEAVAIMANKSGASFDPATLAK